MMPVTDAGDRCRAVTDAVQPHSELVKSWLLVPGSSSVHAPTRFELFPQTLFFRSFDVTARTRRRGL